MVTGETFLEGEPSAALRPNEGQTHLWWLNASEFAMAAPRENTI